MSKQTFYRLFVLSVAMGSALAVAGIWGAVDDEFLWRGISTCIVVAIGLGVTLWVKTTNKLGN